MILEYYELNALSWHYNLLKFSASLKNTSCLGKIWPNFAVWLLIDEKEGVLKYAITKDSKETIQNIANLYKKYNTISKLEWETAVSAAANAYYNGAASAAYNAASDAARAAYNTVRAAANAASDAASVVYNDAARAATQSQAKKLLELLRE